MREGDKYPFQGDSMVIKRPLIPYPQQGIKKAQTKRLIPLAAYLLKATG